MNEDSISYPAPAVKLSNIGLFFGAVRVLHELNLSVASGEKIALTGPSGAGKTSMLALISGLLKPNTGKIETLSLPVSDMNEESLARMRRDNIGIVFQHFHLLDSMTALENVALPLQLAKHPQAKEKAEDSLQAVGLTKRMTHFPAQLSGGEQQRVAIARAFALNPPLLLADEPTGNLDEETANSVLDIIFNLSHKNNNTIIFVTHNNDILDKFDKIYNMANGQVKPA